jgi:hypothetical protein
MDSTLQNTNLTQQSHVSERCLIVNNYIVNWPEETGCCTGKNHGASFTSHKINAKPLNGKHQLRRDQHDAHVMGRSKDSAEFVVHCEVVSQFEFLDKRSKIKEALFIRSPDSLIFFHCNTRAYNVLFVRKCFDQKSVTKSEHLPYL